MPPLLKSLLVLLVGLAAFLPAGDGGGGDTGVWILPRSGCVVGTSRIYNSVPVTRSFSSLTDPIWMSASNEMSAPVATLSMPDGQVLSLPTRGLNVMIPPSALQGLAAAQVPTARGLIVDGNGRGYVFTIALDLAQGSGVISIW